MSKRWWMPSANYMAGFIVGELFAHYLASDIWWLVLIVTVLIAALAEPIEEWQRRPMR